MALRLLDTANVDVASVILKATRGKFKHFLLVIEARNDTGQTLSLANLGSLLAVKKSRNFISNVSLVNLMHIANHLGGVPYFTSTVASTVVVAIPIFCYDPSAPDNILDVQDDDAMTFTMSNLAAFTTALASGTAYLYGDEAEGVQHYMPVFNQVTEVIGSAGNVVKTLTGENFVRLFINSMNDPDISRITIRQDGVTKVNATREALLAMSMFLGNIESFTAGSPIGTSYESALNCAHIPLAYGEISELLSDNLEYDITATGAASPELVSICLDFTPQEQMLSQASAAASLNRKMTFKSEHGKARPVNALKIMSKVDANTVKQIADK